MHRFIMSWSLIFGVIGAGLVFGQTANEPQTVQACLAAVRAFPQQQVKLAREAGKQPNFQEINRAKIALAQKYTAQFKLESVPAKDLIELSQLYQEAAQNDLALTAITKGLASRELEPKVRASALVTAVGVLVAKPTDEQLQQAEAYVAQLDAMGEAFVKQQLRAHARIGGYYSYADMDAKNLEHHEKILALLKPLSAEDRKEFSSLPVSAYQSIALVHANRGDVAKAIDVLQQGKTQLQNPELTKWLDDAIGRYQLIGKTGAALKGDYWLNTDAKQLDVRGKVTLIQFTAHWCVPCRKSYPAMEKYFARYGKDGLQVVFSTELYGFFDKQQSLNAEAEVAADRAYYLEHHKIPFPVAIQAKAGAPQSVTNEKQYLVGGIPQIVLLDRSGVVRMIMVGWDPANEERTTRLIEKLLKQPMGSAQ